MRRVLVPLLVAAVLLPTAATAKKRRPDALLSVVAPANKGTAVAHPWVNVIVTLASGRGLVADPATFRAHIGRTEITDQFHLTTVAGVTAMRARLAAPLLRTGRRNNRLRLVVLSKAGPKGKTKRDIDRIRFRAVDGPNQPPVARLVPSSELIVPGVPVKFSGAKSTDPDEDELTYSWSFGDGGTSAEADPSHVFGDTVADADVGLVVSDGQLEASAQTTIFLTPQLDPGRTPGQLRLEADQALDFQAVAPGTTRTLALRVVNLDTDPTAQVKVEVGINGDAEFSASPSTFALGPGETQQVDVTFGPTTTGHRDADIVVVAAARNQNVVHTFAHGYGGAAPGSGPTMGADTLFYVNRRGELRGTTPGGQSFAVDNNVHTCANDAGGGSRDLCVTSSDCGLAGEFCATSTQAVWDPVDMCADGRGHLYLLSDDVFTDLTLDDTERSVGILDLKLDASGNRTDVTMLRKTTTETTQITCDRLVNGSLYVPEYREITSASRCFRDAQENLLAIKRATGTADTLYRQLDAIEGLDACDDDIDPANDLQAVTTPDGLTRLFGSFDGGFDTGGLYQLVTVQGPSVTPRPLLFSADIHDAFGLHPDGSVLYAVPSDTGASGTISLYKIAPNRVTNGPLRLSSLTPCAVIQVPNNRGRTFIDQDQGAFAVSPLADGSAMVLLSFFSTGGVQALGANTQPVLARTSPLVPQGTYAIEVAADEERCTVLGLVNLEFMGMPRF